MMPSPEELQRLVDRLMDRWLLRHPEEQPTPELRRELAVALLAEIREGSPISRW